MQHIINLAFDVDDQKIIDSIEKHAEATIINDIQKQVEKRFMTRYYSNDPLHEIVEKECRKICLEHENEIVERAIKLVAEKILRKKSIREKITELEKVVENDD